mgnify:CR=1 FL=1
MSNDRNDIIGENPVRTKKHNFGNEAMIEVITYNANDARRTTLGRIGDLERFDGVTWVNIAGLGNTELNSEIGEMFQVSRLDLDDMANVSQRSKIVQREDYLFAVLKMDYLSGVQVVHEHISLLLKGQTLIMMQETPGDVFDPVRERIFGQTEQIRKQKAEYLYYRLMDCIIEQYFDIMEFVEVAFSEVEKLIFEGDKNAMEQVYSLQKELIYLKNDIFPVQDALTRMTKSESPHVSTFMRTYLPDILHKTLQAVDDITTYWDMTKSLYEMQVTKTSNEMNKVMMTLTIFSAIFIPLTFLTGVFGMNLKVLPGSESPNAFYIFSAGCVILVGGMLMFFKKKKWF